MICPLIFTHTCIIGVEELLCKHGSVTQSRDYLNQIKYCHNTTYDQYQQQKPTIFCVYSTKNP